LIRLNQEVQVQAKAGLKKEAPWERGEMSRCRKGKEQGKSWSVATEFVPFLSALSVLRWCLSARSSSANLDTMFASVVVGTPSYPAVLNAGSLTDTWGWGIWVWKSWHGYSEFGFQKMDTVNLDSKSTDTEFGLAILNYLSQRGLLKPENTLTEQLVESARVKCIWETIELTGYKVTKAQKSMK